MSARQAAPAFIYVHNDQLSDSNVITDRNANVEQVSDYYYPFGKARIDQRNSSFDEHENCLCVKSIIRSDNALQILTS